MELGVNPYEASRAANQAEIAAAQFGPVRQQFASIIERAAEASGDLGITGDCLGYHDEWSQALSRVEQHAAQLSRGITEVTSQATGTGDAVAADFQTIGDGVPDLGGITRAINGN